MFGEGEEAAMHVVDWEEAFRVWSGNEDFQRMGDGL